MGLDDRVAADPGLLADLRWAVKVGVPPTVFLRERTKFPDPWWTDRDTAYIRALAAYEANLCPGCQHPLSETTAPENEENYRASSVLLCHRCVARGDVAKGYENHHHPEALLYSIGLKSAS